MATRVKLFGTELELDPYELKWRCPEDPDLSELANHHLPEEREGHEPNREEPYARQLEAELGAEVLELDPTEATKEGVDY